MSEKEKSGLPKGGLRKAWEIIADLTIAQMDLNERLDLLERPAKRNWFIKMKRNLIDKILSMFIGAWLIFLLAQSVILFTQ